MKQLQFDNNFKSVNGINLMKELENAPQKHYGNTQQQGMQQSNDLDYRSRRNITKIAQILHQQNYQQVDQISKLQQNKQQQQSVERLIAQNQDLNSSNNQSKNTSSVLLIPAIRDLNQERILQRLKSRTIHSEQSSPKMEKNTPSNINSEFSSYQCNFPKDFSPKVTEQNTSSNSIGFNQLSNLVYNQCSVARSQSREKELIQSTNLNSLESEWSKIKKEHNFDNRSQSPFRFHSPVLQGQQTGSNQLSYSNIGNESKISNSSNNGASSLSRQFADYQISQKNEWCSSLERSADSTKKTFENNSSSNAVSQKIHKNAFAGEYKSKQKTLIKKSVPLSKINLELVKQEQLSGRQLTAGRKTPKSSSSQQNQKCSQIIISQMTPTNNQFVQSSNSLSNRQHRSSQDNKDESHFQTILDKYQNVHKRQQVQLQQQQQNLNMSNLSNNSSNSFQPTNYQCISTQPLNYGQNNLQEVNNISSFDTSSCSGVENKRNSIYDSRQSFNFKLQKEDSSGSNGTQAQTASQQIYNFSSKIINPSNYYTSPNFNQNLSSTQLNQNSLKIQNNNLTPQQIQPSLSWNLQSHQNIQANPIGSQLVLAQQQSGKSERQITIQSTQQSENQLQKNSQSSSKIHNQIKIMSPKQNDLKTISQRNNLNKQGSSENISSCQHLSSSQISVEQNQVMNSVPKGGIDDVELTTSKCYGKSVATNQQERDVKQIIMNKIHKMNVAKICLKDEDLGSMSYNNCNNNSDSSYNNFQNINNEKNESDIMRCQQQSNLISYSPISSANYERHQILNSSPCQQSNLSSSACNLQVNKPVSLMPMVKYQPQSESKKIQGKAVNSNTTSPDKHENISKVGGIEYKLKQIGSQNQQQVQQNHQSYILQNSQNTNNINPNQYQIQQPTSSQQQIQILTNNNFQEPIKNKNIVNQQNQNTNLQTSSKYQINLAQILQSDNNKLKESNTFNQENLDKKNQANNQSQFHVFSSNSNNSASQLVNQQQYSSQQSYYQRINPLQVSTNINRIISQKASEQHKITQIKSTQNVDQFNYYSKPISQQTIGNKNFILQPQIESKNGIVLKNQQQQQQTIQHQHQQTAQIGVPVDRAFLRSNSSEGQFQLGQLQNTQGQQQKQQNQDIENNCKSEIIKNGILKIEYPNQHANNIISYQNNICLSYKQNTSTNNTNNQYNTAEKDSNIFMPHQNQEKQIQYINKQYNNNDQNSYASNQNVKYQQEQQQQQQLPAKRSFISNQAQNNHDIPKIKKTSSFFAH